MSGDSWIGHALDLGPLLEPVDQIHPTPPSTLVSYPRHDCTQPVQGSWSGMDLTQVRSLRCVSSNASDRARAPLATGFASGYTHASANPPLGGVADERSDAASYLSLSKATRRPPSNSCPWSTTSCASWPPQRLAQEKPGQTLQATALVHEAYLRLVDVKQAQHWNSRGHFFAAAAEAMRRILIESARRKGRREARRRLAARRPRGDRRTTSISPDQLAGPGRGARPTGRRGPLAANSSSSGTLPVWPSTQAAAGARRSRRRPPTGTGPTHAPGCTAHCRRTASEPEDISSADEKTAPGRSHVDRGQMPDEDSMTVIEHQARSIFLRRGDRAADERPAFLDQACGGDADLRGTGRGSYCTPTRRWAAFMAVPQRPGGRHRPASLRRPGHGHRPLQAPGADRRRRHGRGLHGRADSSPSAARWP